MHLYLGKIGVAKQTVNDVRINQQTKQQQKK